MIALIASVAVAHGYPCFFLQVNPTIVKAESAVHDGQIGLKSGGAGRAVALGSDGEQKLTQQTKTREEMLHQAKLHSFILLSVILMGGACKSPLEAFEGPGVHILFIGNSLTYVNDLPSTLKFVMQLGGQEMSVHSVAKPDFALVDHIAGGSDAVSQIQRGGWDFVILQQGPSSLPASRDLLIQGTQQFDQHIRKAGARTALYMVWPDKSRFAFFEDVRVSYKMAADTVGGLFLPAGEAWLAAWVRDASLSLYGSDDFHPSVMGTYLAALVIYERITGGDARELPAAATGQFLTIPDSTVQVLLEAAHTTNDQYK